MTTEKAWDYAVGLIKVDGLEPTEDFKKYIELEKQGKVTDQDLKKYLDKKYQMKEDRRANGTVGTWHQVSQKEAYAD